jgi:hypothetical protein
MGRDLALERAWRDRVRRFERSGLTVREFCEQENLAVHQFFWWRRELRRLRRPRFFGRHCLGLNGRRCGEDGRGLRSA